MRKTGGVGRGYSDSMTVSDQNNLDVWDTWLSGMTFGVGERADGEPWIFLEHVDGGSLPVLRDGFLGFDLIEGTTQEEAQELAAMLRRRVRFVTYTGDCSWPEFSGKFGREQAKKIAELDGLDSPARRALINEILMRAGLDMVDFDADPE